MSQHVPDDDGIYLDHIAHWVPDLEAAGQILERMGFVITPRTEHTHSSAPGAPIAPAGSANHCVMFEQGYLELLTPTADTPIGRELRAGIARYVGLHLAAFCVADAARERQRLIDAGFPQRPTVALQRATRNALGDSDTLRFTVIRPQPGSIAEGRVQFLTHHTPELMWTPELTGHGNGVSALTDLLFCVADPVEASARYQRYLRTPATGIPGGARFDLARGRLTLLEPTRCIEVLGVDPPTVPWMAAYGLRCPDLVHTRDVLLAAGHTLTDGPGGTQLLHLPRALGASMAFHGDRAIDWC